VSIKGSISEKWDGEYAFVLRTLLMKDFRVRYRNGDEIAYVTIVYRGRVVSGAPRPDGDEVTAVEWFPIDSLRDVALNPFATELFRSIGWL